jgi:hypothetical protein
MSSKWRRFEVLLPLQFNDGSDVPAELLAAAVLEIVDHFGAVSYETQNVEGQSASRRCHRARQPRQDLRRRSGLGPQSPLDETVPGPLAINV